MKKMDWIPVNTLRKIIHEPVSESKMELSLERLGYICSFKKWAPSIDVSIFRGEKYLSWSLNLFIDTSNLNFF